MSTNNCPKKHIFSQKKENFLIFFFKNFKKALFIWKFL